LTASENLIISLSKDARAAVTVPRGAAVQVTMMTIVIVMI